ncbi:hypothetical protein B0H16DRAFT_1677208 [Mycena metata]|uniref:C3H1-type domain-containing protein n=1 Tax=Mycena metata TaxID=1033252 RepID=A0AAD7MRP3_9AGAR|nr:hypothetical protein B0H16DRAFT_1677208 [Mycena metata]
MESSLYWLPQTHQPEPPHHPIHHSPPPQQDWQKQQQSQPGSSSVSPNPPHQQPNLDLSDFTTLGDLPVASTSSTSAASPPSAQSPFYPFPGFYGSTTPYYNQQWSSAQPSQSPDPIPLSNYSTLNGATTTTTTAPPAQQQQQQQQPAQMMIDPALTTMNGTTSNGHHPYPQQPNYSAQPTTQQQQRQQLAQYSYGTLPSFQMAYYLPQQHQQQQGTLSPQALHAPVTNSLMNAYYQPQASGSKPPQQLHPQHQPQPPPPPPGPTPEQRRAALLAQIRPLLQANQFSGAGAVANLAQRLYDYGTADVDPATRLEILTKIRDGAGNHYFRAWAENQTAVDITREWLKAAFTASREGGEDAEALGETIMPLLHIIDRLPMSVESLKTSKLGKIVVKLVKDPPTPAIKDMAFNVERRWRQIVSETQPEAMVEDPKSKKRKLADPPTRAALPPLKKAATGTAAARSVVKKEPPASASSKAAAPAVKDAKSDSSFFSAPKPKPKLPSFKKAPPAPPPSAGKKDDGTNVAQPSAIDPFQEVLKAMKTRKGSPLQAVSTPSPLGSGTEASGASMSSMPGRLGKRKKSVTWAPDGKLESIRLIERAIYGDENSEGGEYSSHSVRDLDRSEGAALHMHLFEETVDWSEPLPIEIPAEIPDQGPRGSESQEKATQEQREQTALVSLYMSPSSIPDSPAEPSVVIPDEEVDKDVREMTAGPEVDAVFWSGPPIPPVEPPQPGVPPLSSVADLVGQLAGGVDAARANAMSVDPVMQALPPEQLQHLLAQLSQLPSTQPPLQQQQIHMQMPHQPPPPQAPYGDWPGLNQFSTDYSQSAFNQDDHGGPGERNGWSVNRGGRGRGRGRGRGGGGDDGGYRHSNKKRLCNFFAAGRCKYGDQCDYSHEMY